MDAVETALGAATGPYFLSQFGLVDLTFAPFLERIASSLLYYKGFRVRGEVRLVGLWGDSGARQAWDAAAARAVTALACLPAVLLGLPPTAPPHPIPPHIQQGRWPNLERWFEAMEARPAYAGFKSDHYTHVHDLPPQLGSCVSGAVPGPLLGATARRRVLCTPGRGCAAACA